MCTPQRSIDVEDTMSFGTSETLKTNMINGNVDCVVGACEGVGTLLSMAMLIVWLEHVRE